MKFEKDIFLSHEQEVKLNKIYGCTRLAWNHLLDYIFDLEEMDTDKEKILDQIKVHRQRAYHNFFQFYHEKEYMQVEPINFYQPTIDKLFDEYTKYLVKAVEGLGEGAEIYRPTFLYKKDMYDELTYRGKVRVLDKIVYLKDIFDKEVKLPTYEQITLGYDITYVGKIILESHHIPEGDPIKDRSYVLKFSDELN